MRRVHWLVLIVAVVLAGLVAGRYVLPGAIRHMVIARVEALTNRRLAIDSIDLHLLRGGLAINGFHLSEREGGAPFADFDRLEVRLRLRSLLRGHLRVHDLVLRKPTVRVVRLANGFNFSDLLEGSGPRGSTTGPAVPDITVDRFVLVGGTVRLEDRALPQERVWMSENVQIEAHDVSTRRDDGTAVGTSVTAGAPTRIE